MCRIPQIMFVLFTIVLADFISTWVSSTNPPKALNFLLVANKLMELFHLLLYLLCLVLIKNIRRVFVCIRICFSTTSKVKVEIKRSFHTINSLNKFVELKSN